MNEIDKLRSMLKTAGVPFESYIEVHNQYTRQFVHITCEADTYSRNQVIYGRNGVRWKLDAIYQYGSYCRTEGKIELWGQMIEGDPITATAQEAFDLIIKDWKAAKNGEHKS